MAIQARGILPSALQGLSHPLGGGIGALRIRTGRRLALLKLATLANTLKLLIHFAIFSADFGIAAAVWPARRSRSINPPAASTPGSVAGQASSG